MRDARGAWADIAALGVSQIVGDGTLYYSFGILASAMARKSGGVFGARSVAPLPRGLVILQIARWLDRFGAGRVMTAESVVAAAPLLVAAHAPAASAFVVELVAIEVAFTFVRSGAAFPCSSSVTRARRSGAFCTSP